MILRRPGGVELPGGAKVSEKHRNVGPWRKGGSSGALECLQKINEQIYSN